MIHPYNERHWAAAAIALAGLLVFGYFYESLRQLLGSDVLLMGVALLYLICLRELGNYIAGKVSSSKSTKQANASNTLSAVAYLCTLLLLLSSPNDARSGAGGDITYEDIAPILAERCTLCHAGDSAPLGLRLDSFDAVMKGSLKGAVVKAGDPAASELIRRLQGTSQPRMPMTGPPFLSDSQISLFERWVAGGLLQGDASAATATVAPTRPAPGEPVNYTHVAPILSAHCARCHADRGLMGSAPEGYRLTSYGSTLSAADRMRVVPGNPQASELVRRIRGQARPRMPFDGPPYLSDEDIQLIERWIAGGARSVEGIPAAVPAGARVRLHGTLQSRWNLDGLPLAVGARTRIDKSPAPGDYVEVRGYVGDGGVIVVERLRRR